MNITDAIAAEKAAAQMRAQIIENIRNQISENPMNGVTKLGHGCFQVNLQTIRQQKGMNLSPEYYSCEKQAELVSAALSNTKEPTITRTVEKLRELVENGFVEINKNRYELNPKTLDTLKAFLAEVPA